jgi:hypothetical protein
MAIVFKQRFLLLEEIFVKHAHRRFGKWGEKMRGWACGPIPPTNKTLIFKRKPGRLVTRPAGLASIAAAQVLHLEQAWRIEFGIHLTLELAGCAVLGLHVHHGEQIVNRDTGAFVHRQVVIGV